MAYAPLDAESSGIVRRYVPCDVSVITGPTVLLERDENGRMVQISHTADEMC